MSNKNLTFADKQRIYDENLAREKRFASLYSGQEKPEYFLNPFRGRKNQAVADPVGGSRGKKFLDRDEAFIRSRENTPAFRDRASVGATPLPFGGNNHNTNSNDERETPLPYMRNSPTPTSTNLQQHRPPSSDVNNNNNFVSPTPTAAARHQQQHSSPSNGGGGGIYDTKTSIGRSLLRMRMSNAVLKPKTQLHGVAVKFDADLKSADRPPQLRYGYPRTEAHSYGWYNKPLEEVDKPPSNEIRVDDNDDLVGGDFGVSPAPSTTTSGTNNNNNNNPSSVGRAASCATTNNSELRTRMGTGGYFLAKGLKTAQWK